MSTIVKKRYLPSIVGLFVALGLPFTFSLYLGTVRDHLEDHARVIQALAREWGIVIILLLLIVFWERQSLSSIGIRRMSWQDALWALGGFLLGAVSFIITGPIVGMLGLGTTASGITVLAQTPVALRVAIVLTAGVTEEILFRGYPIERLYRLTGRLGLSAGIAYLAFTALHIPFWGLGGTIQIGVWSLIVTALYVWRRNLLACMLMHILNDAYAFILLPSLFAQYLLR